MKGYIKDFRKELQSDVWLMPPLYHRVWQYLKYKVNHKENKIPMKDGSFLTVVPGQHLTSIRTIAENVGWYERGVLKTPNPKTISGILDWLEKQKMIEIGRGEGNRQYTLITLLNWESYQVTDDESNSKETVSKQCADINKNEKNEKNEKKKEITTTTAPENPVQLFEYLLCRLSPIQMNSLYQWVDDFKGNQEIVNAAIKLADNKNKRNFNFVEFLLKEWHSNNLMDIDRVRAYEREKFNNSKVKPFARKGKGVIRTEMLPDWFEESEQQSKPQTSDQQVVNDGEQMSEFERLMELRKNSGS
ncbi:DnaD domain-containing protein [Cytobacillus kochii]|uniref:DnaD domain-containing protein n=1 Tax=Cytobacillus kochii TaxID=859143 RepID=UPI00203BAC71|nr:DnaD domain protein [Cytobacillus kochii]MCM3324266.1 DnaD domain protein [Cytobacillus kochii]MCM3346665.1 DnaD domain protein [Cytobacillus kochii]